MLIQTGSAPAGAHPQTAAAAGTWYTFPPKHSQTASAALTDFTQILSQAKTVTETARQNHLAGTVGVADIRGLKASLAFPVHTSLMDGFTSLDPAKVAQLFG